MSRCTKKNCPMVGVSVDCDLKDCPYRTEADQSKDTIYREDAIEVASRECHEFRGIFGRIEEGINGLPSADRPQGEWIPCTKSGLPLTELMRREEQKWYGYRCSNCNHIYKGNALTDCNFCPNCGARIERSE